MRKGARGRWRGDGWQVFVCLLWLVAGGARANAQALTQEGEPTGGGASPDATTACDIADAMTRGIRFMESENRPIAVLTALESGRACVTEKEASLYYRLLSIAYAHLGRVDEARESVDRALEYAAEEDIPSLERLKRLLNEGFSLVTFSLPAGQVGVPDVRIESFDVASLPDGSLWEAVGSRRQVGFTTKVYLNAAASGKDRMARDVTYPFSVWLPTGDYTLNSGRVFLVRGASTSVMIDVGTARWSKQSFVVSSSFMTGDLKYEHEFASGAQRRPGIAFDYARRFKLRHRSGSGVQIALEGELWIGGTYQNGYRLEPTEDLPLPLREGTDAMYTEDEVEWDPQEGTSGRVGLAIRRPVVLGSDRLFLVPGLGVSFYSMGQLEFPGSDEYYQLSGYQFYGGIGTVEARVHIRLAGTAAKPLELVASGMLGAGPGRVVSSRADFPVIDLSFRDRIATLVSGQLGLCYRYGGDRR